MNISQAEEVRTLFMLISSNNRKIAANDATIKDIKLKNKNFELENSEAIKRLESFDD